MKAKPVIDKTPDMKDIQGLGGRYVASKSGAVYNAYTGRKLAVCKGVITMYDTTGKRVYRRHNQLIADTFIDNPKGYKFVLHKDGDYTNCNVDNLMWSSTFYKSQGCIVLFDESGTPHLFRGYHDFAKKTGYTRGKDIAALVNGRIDKLGPWHSKRYIEKQMDTYFTAAERKELTKKDYQSYDYTYDKL